MSVCLRDGVNDQLADSIGMEISVIEGTKLYQYVVRETFSKTVEREVLKKLIIELQNVYPDDVFSLDESISAIISMVDSKDLIDTLNGNR